ncbi:DNA-binding response regulator [Claveliimonas bilis]|uniref:response regulator transcription factor n=1 Tax=Claveliimonas bilis TaxID=3028070 RepID=UPI002931BDBA|nr:response regulator transcription factor [Claveliimonas bilis]BDZ82025.1 DNA-binding response regulator [Claveliimonas bilis]
MRILLVEDDAQMNEALKIFFCKAGYTVLQAYNAKEAEQCLNKEPDIIIADIGLPGTSGIDFCKKLLKYKTIPVIFLTAKDDEEDIMKGYEAGCQEYVTKPVSPKILLKKIEVILKRSGLENIMEYKDLRIDFDKRKVWNCEKEIKLTVKEWKVLSILAANRGNIVTKEILLEKIWDADNNFVDDHALTVGINRLRKKIEQNPSTPVYIKNVFGVGYTFGE